MAMPGCCVFTSPWGWSPVNHWKKGPTPSHSLPRITHSLPSFQWPVMVLRTGFASLCRRHKFSFLPGEIKRINFHQNAFTHSLTNQSRDWDGRNWLLWRQFAWVWFGRQVLKVVTLRLGSVFEFLQNSLWMRGMLENPKKRKGCLPGVWSVQKDDEHWLHVWDRGVEKGKEILI